jgi:hypothetical protein
MEREREITLEQHISLIDHLIKWSRHEDNAISGTSTAMAKYFLLSLGKSFGITSLTNDGKTEEKP